MDCTGLIVLVYLSLFSCPRQLYSLFLSVSFPIDNDNNDHDNDNDNDNDFCGLTRLIVDNGHDLL